MCPKEGIMAAAYRHTMNDIVNALSCATVSPASSSTDQQPLPRGSLVGTHSESAPWQHFWLDAYNIYKYSFIDK